MKILVDIDNVLVGTIDKKNKTGLYWTSYNIICKMLEEKFDITFITNKYTIGVFNDFIKTDSNFSHTNCISLKYNYEKFIILDKILTILVKNRILYKQRKRDSSEHSLKKIYNFIIYLIFSLLYKILDLPTKFLFNNEILNFDVYQSMFYRIPDKIMYYKNIKKFLFIHDLLPLIRTRDFSKKKKKQKKSRGNFYKIFKNVNKDTTLICNSESTKNDLIDHFPNFKENKILVAPLAADKKQFYKIEHDDINYKNKVLQKYQIPINSKYLLSLSSLNPRKNLIFLLDCFIEFLSKNKNIQDLYLVLAGPKGWKIDNLFEKIADCKEYKDKIILTGFLDEKDINCIYNNALFFVFPSLYEGFGLPVLEAMQCGVPVISSNKSSMPEVYGDAALPIDPENKDDLMEAIEKLYYDENLRKNLSEKGLTRSKLFDWSKTVKIMTSGYSL